jgi:hypothetical protein
LSEAFAAIESAEPGDVWGTPFAIRVRNEITPDWSAALDEASALSEAHGRKGGVVIQHRRGSAAARSYAVMTLETFAGVLRDLGVSA